MRCDRRAGHARKPRRNLNLLEPAVAHCAVVARTLLSAAPSKGEVADMNGQAYAGGHHRNVFDDTGLIG